MDTKDVPGYKIIEDKIKEINKEISIAHVAYDSSRMAYKFHLVRNDRKCGVVFSREFLDDLNDYTGSKKSEYWKKMESALASALLAPIERQGLTPFTKEKLKELIFEHVKEALQSTKHINKFNLLGRPYQEGSLENFLNVKFTHEERAAAGMAFDELRTQGILVPTYEDLIHPEDWVKIGEVNMEQKKVTLENKQLKVFISYSTKDKVIAARVKGILYDFGIEGFLAHEDINVSEEWKQRIKEELSQSDIFVCLLSKDFRNSEWAPQETGIAYFKDILIIPLRLDETIPFGFINHLQGKPIDGSNIPLTLLIKPIVDKFSSIMIAMAIKRLENAGSFRYAESVMELLVPYFNEFKQEEIDAFAEASINNNQVWSAELCRRKYLPQFIEINRSKINPRNLEILSYQIEKNERYPHLI